MNRFVFFLSVTSMILLTIDTIISQAWAILGFLHGSFNLGNSASRIWRRSSIHGLGKRIGT